jgi:hypothetical protein
MGGNVAETIELTDVFLRILGAFYAFAGFVATRAALTSHFLDRAIAAISMQAPKPAETAQTVWLLAAAALVLAGGVLLLAGLEAAAWAFVASALGQAAYIYILAPRYFDRDDPPDAQGRRQTTNAFALYAAATAFILWAAWRGRLTSFADASTVEFTAVGAALILYAAYVARTLWWQPRASRGAFSAIPDDEPSLPPHESKRIKVMADYQCDPLWALDEERYGCFSPDMIEMSPELREDLKAWALAFDSQYDCDDPAAGLWDEAQHLAHAAEGRRLALRLKRERPDLMVYVMDAEVGVVEVHADERN